MRVSLFSDTLRGGSPQPWTLQPNGAKCAVIISMWPTEEGSDSEQGTEIKWESTLQGIKDSFWQDSYLEEYADEIYGTEEDIDSSRGLLRTGAAKR